jgi:hypothetical protein
MNMAATAVPIQEWAIRIALSIVGIIHVLPMIGITGRIALEKGYGLAIDSPDLQLLLQHRAVLFGLLGAACFIAAFNPPWRLAIWCSAMISTCSFLLFSGLASSTNVAIVRVIWFDLIAIAMLLLAAFAHAFRQS